jgi:hypothetical protein
MSGATAAADPNVKQIRLVAGTGATGEEGDSLLQEGGEGQTRKRGRGGGRRANHKTFKIGSITKEGGGSTSPGTMTQLAASHVPGGVTAAASASAVGVDSALTQKGAPVGGGGGGGGAGAAAASAAPAPTAPVKVVLAAPKKGGSKVVLAAAAAPKLAGHGSGSGGAAAPSGGGSTAAKTRKHKGGAARKIRVSMSSLSKKIHRAKTIRHKAKDDSLAEVKKALHKAGLIKAESKAPETVLRQMYADFLTLKSRAL